MSTPVVPIPVPLSGLRDRSALLLGEWFGCGRSRYAPGTVGALGTLPLYVCIRSLSPPSYWFIAVAITAIGIWASGHSARILAVKDPSRVVIDEVAGTLLALGFVRGHVALEVCAWTLFRLLDITKPGFIDRAQYLEPAGIGIMADDILAGLGAGTAAWFLGVTFFLP